MTVFDTLENVECNLQTAIKLKNEEFTKMALNQLRHALDLIRESDADLYTEIPEQNIRNLGVIYV